MSCFAETIDAMINYDCQASCRFACDVSAIAECGILRHIRRVALDCTQQWSGLDQLNDANINH
jgi:hypothetical protein